MQQPVPAHWATMRKEDHCDTEMCCVCGRRIRKQVTSGPCLRTHLETGVLDSEGEQFLPIGRECVKALPADLRPFLVGV